ncbi:MAG: 30S ribosomal protein S6 [Spirochaetes bacterium]|nr:30S ribosomal protein S6 [Spirochaetota bacterium]
MRKYEIMLIFNIEENSLEENKKFTTDTFSSNNISIIDEKDIGQKELSYPINNKTRGHYFLYHINVNPESLLETEKAFKLYKGIMRYLIIRQK